MVHVGVYLPSNPDGEVIDIDRKSGRPLQSHAKVIHFSHDRCCSFELTIPFLGTVHGDVQSSKDQDDCRRRSGRGR